MATATETKRHIWTEKEEIQFCKDWQASESIGEMVDKYWSHPAFDDLNPQTEKEEEKARVTIASRLQSRAANNVRKNLECSLSA